MLQNLHVKNLALIDEVEVDFGPGLNILTGETGARKSIILGSVNLTLGGRYNADMLSTPLSVIAGLVLGEFAVQSGWFNSEVMLYMAFVAVANYTQPNFEMGYALKFMRLMLLVLTALFDWVGFLVGCLLILCFLACNKTLSGRNYLNIKLN